MLKKLPLFLLLLIISFGASAQLPYHMDSTFGNNGVVVVSSTTFGAYYTQKVNYMTVMADGRIVLGGYAGGTTQVQLIRLNPNGTMDSTFNGTGAMNFSIGSAYAGQLSDMKVDATGNIFLSGAADYTGHSSVCIYKINNAGVADGSFGAGGTAIITNLNPWESNYCSDLQSDGKIVTCGSTQVSGVNNFMIERLLPNGTLDAAYGSGGRALCPYTPLLQLTGSQAAAVVCQPDDKALVSGVYANIITSEYNLFLVRYKTDGTPDSTFGTDGLLQVPTGGLYDKQLQLSATGDIYAICKTDIPSTAIIIYKISGAGMVDATYGTGGMVRLDSVQANYPFSYTGSMLQPDGKILIAGTRDTGINANYTVTRFKADGSLDSAFGVNGTYSYTRGLRDICATGAIQANGDILMAGGGRPSFSSDTTLPVCIRITDSIHHISLSAQQLHPSSSFTAFPNPSASGAYTISCNEPVAAQLLSLNLLDVSGRLLLHTEKAMSGRGIFTYSLPSSCADGVYYLQIAPGDKDEESQTLKLVKKQ